MPQRHGEPDQEHQRDRDDRHLEPHGLLLSPVLTLKTRPARFRFYARQSEGRTLNQHIEPGPEFGRLFETFEHTAFRLEVREAYNSPRETESFRRFRVGEDIDMSWAEGWLSTIRRATAEGKRFARVRVVSLPLSDYSRFGLWASRLTTGAGEDIRYLAREKARQCDLPNHDYWLFDSRKLLRMHFGDADKFLGGEIITNPAEVVEHNHWRDVARHHAVSRADFMDIEAPS